MVAHAGRDNSGNLEYVGVVTDITERKYADEEREALSRSLKESKARIEEAQRVAHVGHYEWNLIAKSRDLVRRALSHLWAASAGRSH